MCEIVCLCYACSGITLVLAITLFVYLHLSKQVFAHGHALCASFNVIPKIFSVVVEPFKQLLISYIY